MSTSINWQHLGDRPPAALTDARLQLHWAAQLVSAVGTTLLPPAPDDSHTNLEWLAESQRLAGRLTADAPRCRAALRPDDLRLGILDERDRTVAEHELHGRTFSQGMVWLEQEIAAFTARPLPKPLRRRQVELPPHAVGSGAPFSTRDAATFAELGRWYANANQVLRRLVATLPNASEVRCWPHHFDIATLVTERPGRAAEPARTIGIGLSPGDASYAEPYWYVSPFPYPETPRLPVLDGGGAWHRTDWLGAVLTGSTIVAADAAEAQAALVQAFLGSAIDACRDLLMT